MLPILGVRLIVGDSDVLLEVVDSNVAVVQTTPTCGGAGRLENFSLRHKELMRGLTSGWKSRHMTPQGAWHRNSG